MSESATLQGAPPGDRIVVSAPASKTTGYEVVERSREIPVVSGVADIADYLRGLPLLTAIEAPAGTVLVLDELRVDAAAVPWKLLRADLASMSEMAKGFAEYLTPEQLQCVPAVFDLRAYETVRVELPPESTAASITVRGLNVLVTGVHYGSLRERFL